MMTWQPLQLPLTKQARMECWATACCLWMLSGSLRMKACLQHQVPTLDGPSMGMLLCHSTGRCSDLAVHMWGALRLVFEVNFSGSVTCVASCQYAE